jgi:CrcB protein
MRVDGGELRIVGLVAAGGALGSVLRYLVAGALTRGDFPWGTAVVNISGSFGLALLFFLALQQGSLSAELRALAFIGVFGGYTTMSSFSLETVTLMTENEWAGAAANVFLNVGLCLGGAVLGRAAGLALGGP